jgi:hypothetical protein
MGASIPAASRAAEAFRTVRRPGVVRLGVGLSNFIIFLKDI